MDEPRQPLSVHRYRMSGDIFDWEPHGALDPLSGEQMINLQLALLAQGSYLAVLVGWLEQKLGKPSHVFRAPSALGGVPQ